jgi:hypothetical protein
MPLGGLAAEVEPDRMVEAGALETRHGPDASGQVASLPAIYISTSPHLHISTLEHITRGLRIITPATAQDHIGN